MQRWHRHLVIGTVIAILSLLVGIQAPRIRTDMAISRLSSKDLSTRARAIEHLKQARGDYAVRKLAQRVIDFPRIAARGGKTAQIMKGRPPADVSTFIRVLAEKRRTVNLFGRHNTVMVLRDVAAASPVEAGREIAALAAHPNDDVREAVAQLLGEVDGEIAEPPLLKMLSDTRTAVRIAAVTSLGAITSTAAVEPLAEIFRSDPNDALRSQAARSLGQIGDPAAAEALASALEDPHAGAEAITALGRLDEGAGVAKLAELLKSGPEGARFQAVEALPAAADDRAFQLLLSAAGDESERIRQKVAYLLGRLPERPVLDCLVNMIADTSGSVRRSAVTALQRLHHEKAVRPLITLLDDEAQDVRLYAATALCNLGGRSQEAPLIEAVRDGRVPVTTDIVAAFCGYDDPRGVELLAELSRPGSERGARTRRAIDWEIGQSKRRVDGSAVLWNGEVWETIEHCDDRKIKSLLNTLYRTGTLAMAKDFYWSGSDTLRYAARLWALRNGLYEKLAASEDSPARPKWGRGGNNPNERGAGGVE